MRLHERSVGGFVRGQPDAVRGSAHAMDDHGLAAEDLRRLALVVVERNTEDARLLLREHLRELDERSAIRRAIALDHQRHEHARTISRFTFANLAEIDRAERSLPGR